jgi:hypothetical protein
VGLRNRQTDEKDIFAFLYAFRQNLGHYRLYVWLFSVGLWRPGRESRRIFNSVGEFAKWSVEPWTPRDDPYLSWMTTTT